jgi:uncharacterized protein (UPF0128 family)
LRGQIHDCFYDYTEEVPTEYQISLVIHMLPEDIKLLAEIEGEWDTEVGDKVYRWLRKYDKKVFLDLDKENPEIHQLEGEQ